MDSIKEFFIEETEEKEISDYYKGRPDYYPFNQTFLDHFFKEWSKDK